MQDGRHLLLHARGLRVIAKRCTNSAEQSALLQVAEELAVTTQRKYLRAAPPADEERAIPQHERTRPTLHYRW
jgi:hypothetical protein